MKRGTLLGKEPRVGQKAHAAFGSPDFASVISVFFSGYFPAAVSDSETVFLCPLSSSATPCRQLNLRRAQASPTPLLTGNLPPQTGAAAFALGRAGSWLHWPG